MPLAKYFKGQGQQVMDPMKKSTGGDPEAAKNARDLKPPVKRKTFGQRIGSKD